MGAGGEAEVQYCRLSMGGVGSVLVRGGGCGAVQW